MRTYAPLLGFVYVPLGVLALALGTDHQQAAARALRRRRVRAALVPRQPARPDHPLRPGRVLRQHRRARRRLAARAPGRRARLARRPGRRARAQRARRRVIIGSSLAALDARKVPAGSAALGIAGGVAVLLLGVCEAAADWTFVGSTFWASSLGFMIWVLVDRDVPREAAADEHARALPAAARAQRAGPRLRAGEPRARVARRRGSRRWPASGSRSRS